jgi:hypothetical protein
MSTTHAANTVKFAMATTSATLIAKLTPQLLKAGVTVPSGVIGVNGMLESICEGLDQQLKHDDAIGDPNKIITGMVGERCRQLRELVIVLVAATDFHLSVYLVVFSVLLFFQIVPQLFDKEPQLIFEF